jgi:hypothetical protein
LPALSEEGAEHSQEDIPDNTLCRHKDKVQDRRPNKDNENEKTVSFQLDKFVSQVRRQEILQYVRTI